MQNMLSIILAVIIGLTSMCGGVANVGKPVSMEGGIAIDGDIAGLATAVGGEMAGQTAQMFDMLKNIISALSFRVAADATTAQGEILVNGESAISFAVKQEGEGWSAVSNLFPSAKLTMKNETLAQYTSMMGPVASMNFSMDPTALGNLAAQPIAELTAALLEKIGEPEIGTYEIHDVVFTTKAPINMTTKEALTLILDKIQPILSSESVASALAMAGQGFSPEKLNQAIEELKNKDESELPVMDAAVYGSEDGSACFVINLTKDEETIVCTLITAGQDVYLNVDAKVSQGNAGFEFVTDTENRIVVMSGSFEADMISLSGDATAATDENGCVDVLAHLNLGKDGKGVDLTIAGSIAYDAPVFAASEGLTETALETMMESEEAASAFGNDLMTGLMMVLANLMQQFPELATLFSGGMQTVPAN